MRILTVRQPWAWAIIHGGKDVENRVRNIAGDYRGPVAIHVAQALDMGAFSGRVSALTDAANHHTATTPDILQRSAWFHNRGAIIGVVNLVGVHRGYAPSRTRSQHVGSCYQAGKPWGPCSPWAEPHNWHLELANPRPLAVPVLFKGALGLRRLDAATQALVEREAQL